MNLKRMAGSVFTVLLALTFLVGFNVSARAEGNVTVFAAASLTNSLNAIGKLFAQKDKCAFTPSYLSSSTLAKQIENGAPANVFISADEKWMDYLAKKKVIDPASRFNLLGNRLVLIAPSGSKLNKVEITRGFNLARLLAGGKLSVGDPAHVPAGIYAKQALESLGVWNSVKGSLAREADVRLALVLVERGEAPLGIVYATDAAITKKVKIIGVFPASSHPPIVYPAALVTGQETPAARSFLEFLKTPQARAIFEKYGFSVIE
ncbi:MAG: molybdate ABC transporter substrate-binding protein [Deltaproteobacteria bacterium]|nr:molybdate ABC transporter substrate-binding protein [Deltaproteobacteria bacterium]